MSKVPVYTHKDSKGVEKPVHTVHNGDLNSYYVLDIDFFRNTGDYSVSHSKPAEFSE